MKSFGVHFVLILVSCIFGVNYVVSKYLLQFLTPGAWAFVRATLTALILFALVWPRIKKKPPTLKQWLIFFYLGFFGVVVNQISFFEGLQRTTPTDAAVINASIPVFTLLFSILIGQEKPNWRRISGIVTSLAGVLIVLHIEQMQFRSSHFWGDLLNVLNSMSFAAYLVLSRPVSRKTDPLVVTTGMFVFGAACMSVYGGEGALHAPWLSFPAAVFYAMAFVVLFASVTNYYLNNWALARTESSFVALYIYLQPVVAAALSHFLYHEELTGRLAFGSLLVFAGVAIGTLVPMKEKKGIYVQTEP